MGDSLARLGLLLVQKLQRTWLFAEVSTCDYPH